MKNFISVLIFLVSTAVFSQFSKVHYLPPVSNSDSQSVNGQYLYISTPNILPVNFTVKSPNGTTILTATVSRNSPYVYTIGSGSNTQILIDKNDVGKVMTNKGLLVEATDLIYACIRYTSSPESYQAGSIVSKGLAAPGKLFRIGAFTNKNLQSTDGNHYTFATILALENNTQITFSDIKSGVVLINNPNIVNGVPAIVLNQGESYCIAVQGPEDLNRDGLIGVLIDSKKNIVVNCGSFGGSNGDLRNLDLGMDQIVSTERIGKEYIFVKGQGSNIVERPLIIAHENGTEVFVNDDLTKIATLDAGEYIAIDGSKFSSSGNMFVRTTKNVFAYQGIGGTSVQANQNMHFVPPLNCATPKKIDNIPLINEIGNNKDFNGTVAIVTEVGAILSFTIDGINYTLADLPSSINKIGPKSVSGNLLYETYNLTGLKGNISVFADKSLYLSYYGSSSFATYGGFYSGFTFDPEITFNNLSASQTACLPFVKLEVNTISAFDNLKWFKDGVAISGANSNSYQPVSPGYYYVEGTINACGAAQIYKSTEIPVSICSPDADNDLVNDNIDLDLDNDAISNCQESFGDLKINTSIANAGNINYLTEYNNSFSSTIINIPSTSSGTFTGNSDNFVTQIPIGKGKKLKYEMVFVNPISISLEYASNAIAANLLNSNANFIVNCNIDSTISVLNLDNQLLIDTNYDGIYESGVTRFSSFEIRFRLNNTTPLAAGTGTFSFRSHLVKKFSITHENLSETQINNATFSLIATCIPKDNDSDGTIDQLDLDTDNDGILDYTEYFGHNTVPIYSTLVDANLNGIKDTFEIVGDFPWDTDADGVKNYLDLDTDNDGIYDLYESVSNLVYSNIDTNQDGIIDGNPLSFGSNGFSNSLETNIDNGILNYNLSDSDNDTNINAIDGDSDNDGCPDVRDAGFFDQNQDGFLGDTNPVVNSNGKIISAIDGFTTPTQNYLQAGNIIINTEPIDVEQCNLQNATFKIETNNIDSYKWQETNALGNFIDISDNTVYSGTNTNELTITAIPANLNNKRYRVFLNTAGNSCGDYSRDVNLTVFPVPVLIPNLTLKQCDIDSDFVSDFNLNEKNSLISTNYLNEDFSFYTDENGAIAKDINKLISNPEFYNSGSKTIGVRVENKITNCFSTTKLNLVVSIPPTVLANYFPEINECDDFLDQNGLNNSSNSDSDGITNFDLNTIKTDIFSRINNSTDYNIKFYDTLNKALLEFDVNGNSLEISNINSFRNINSPNQQTVYARAENNSNNDCFGIITVKLIVNPLPKIKLTENEFICINLTNTFLKLSAGIQDNSSSALYSYIWTKDNVVLQNQTNATIDVNISGIYTVKVTNKTSNCFRIRTITTTESEIAKFLEPTIVDLVDANSVTINVTGSGNYEFAIDNKDGIYQTSNIFTNVPFGQHEFFVNDTNNCGIVSQIINVIGAPNYFTPNGDGLNDYWNIKGIDAKNIYSNVTIYDQFGKLLKQFAVNSNGWDGKLNDQQLPANDYWYVLNLQDGRIAKGHFSLKR